MFSLGGQKKPFRPFNMTRHKGNFSPDDHINNPLPLSCNIQFTIGPYVLSKKWDCIKGGKRRQFSLKDGTAEY